MRFKKYNLKKDKGVAGLTVLLSLVTMLFIIGLIVMIFALMGSELQDSTYDRTTIAVANETTTIVMNSSIDMATVGYNLSVITTRRNPTCTIGIVTNETHSSVTIETTNYTTDNCAITMIANDGAYNNSAWNVSYSYEYDEENSATNVMNDTITGLSDVTNWFGIFIVIGAMIVLILLTVIIITAIRGSGMMGDSGYQGNVGSA